MVSFDLVSIGGKFPLGDDVFVDSPPVGGMIIARGAGSTAVRPVRQCGLGFAAWGWTRRTEWIYAPSNC